MARRLRLVLLVSCPFLIACTPRIRGVGVLEEGLLLVVTHVSTRQVSEPTLGQGFERYHPRLAIATCVSRTTDGSRSRETGEGVAFSLRC